MLCVELVLPFSQYQIVTYQGKGPQYKHEWEFIHVVVDGLCAGIGASRSVTYTSLERV